jgi:outer membrane protein insertion porin family
LTGLTPPIRTALLRSTLGPAFLLLVMMCGYARAQHVPIRSLTIEGNHLIESARLRSQFRICREGGWYDRSTLDWELRNLENYYGNEGFLDAKVGPPTVEFQPDPSNVRVALIRVPVVEGPRYTVGEVAVKNVQAFPSATLLQMCPLWAGQPYSRQKIVEWQGKIGEGYRTMGYIRFRSSAREKIHEVTHVIDCTLECIEGNAYIVGSITVNGAESINRADFKRHLLVGEGGLYSPEMLSLSIQFLNQMNLYRPITGSDVEINIDDSKSRVDLVFHLVLRQSPGPKSH